MEPYRAGPHFLAGDADRDRAIETLKQCFQDGRINADELSERIGHALNARTFGDLDIVLTGLPAVRPMPAMYPNLPSFYQLPQRNKWNGMGLTAFILGVFGFICGITAIPAVALGAAALSVDPDREDKGFAIAGIAVGGFWLILLGWLIFH